MCGAYSMSISDLWVSMTLLLVYPLVYPFFLQVETNTYWEHPIRPEFLSSKYDSSQSALDSNTDLVLHLLLKIYFFL